MTKAILSVGALLAAAIALAGCGGGGSASGTTMAGTTGGVAGAQHAQGSGKFRANVHGFEARIRTSVDAFRSGNLSKAISSGGPLLTNCLDVVDTKFANHASTSIQKKAVAHLRSACAAMTEAANAGSSGNTTKAKQFAAVALRQAKIAARLSG